jgi:Transmembrane domain of unknown function (DUF3566)
MSDRARSSVRTETRGGSGTTDGVPEDAPRADDRADAGAGSAPAAPHGSSAAKQTADVASTPDATQSVAKPAVGKSAGGKQADAKVAEPVAAPSAPVPPAAHPVTPLTPAGAPKARPAEDARPVNAPAPPVPAATGRPAGSGLPTGTQLPIDATQAVTLPPAGARPIDPASRPAASRPTERPADAAKEKTGKRGVGRGPRRARLQLRHVDTWSALKISLVLSIALFCVWMIAVGILYGVLGGLGVFDTLNDLIGQLSSSSGDEQASSDVISAGVVFGGAAVIGAVNIVLLTALCTVTAFIYNLCSDLVGGLEVTLAERD